MKTKTLFVCQNCGAQSSKWQGKCASCDSWNSIVEEVVSLNTAAEDRKSAVLLKEEPVLLAAVMTAEERRLTTGVTEFDRVLGGGLIPGSVTLIGGDPGIGKSTLSLQAACALAAAGSKVLYVSGEESVKQAKMRADRLSAKDSKSLYIVNQVDLNGILEYIQTMRPDILVVDSIQVVYLPGLVSSPGSVAQVRECAGILTQTAKSLGMSVILIGHVTKEGTLAGPRVLEHLVDTVLYFEGERYSSYRVLRTTKNRFGSTNELGVFEMTAQGLAQVSNPSEIFLSERPQNASGSVVVPILEGTRPFLVEVQGLVSRSTFGVVRQKAQGFDPNRLALLAAVLEKRLGLNLQDKDIFLNIVGGVKVMDPAADLAVSLAVASALLDKRVPFDTVVLGEVGLSAEVRSVSQLAVRLTEAQKMGFKRCVIPKNNLKIKNELKNFKLDIFGVETVRQALEVL